jgi:hypothetical protein
MQQGNFYKPFLYQCPPSNILDLYQVILKQESNLSLLYVNPMFVLREIYIIL